MKDDKKLLLSFILAFLLNSYIVLCFFLFRKEKSPKAQLTKQKGQ